VKGKPPFHTTALSTIHLRHLFLQWKRQTSSAAQVFFFFLNYERYYYFLNVHYSKYPEVWEGPILILLLFLKLLIKEGSREQKSSP
jgi:hypothetical protein